MDHDTTIRAAWLDQLEEDVLEPERRIVDPHHHLWPTARLGSPYLLEDLLDDTGSGHRIEKTVFVECRACYRDHGPPHLRPVGETEFVAAQADAGSSGEAAAAGGAVIAGIVAHADLTLERSQLDELLDAHREAAGGRFRGIRHSGARDRDPAALFIPGRGAEGLYRDERFRAGVGLLGERDLTYDTWHYHHQNRAYVELARACPDTLFVLDHFGTPLGVGRFEGRREEIWQAWKSDIAEIARCPNVVAKLGGLAMPDNGFGWHQRERPPSSDELVAQQQRYYLHTVECFGPERCMLESNFPVDKLSISYRVLWNAFKKMAADLSESEKHALFYGTAERVYRLGDDD